MGIERFVGGLYFYGTYDGMDLQRCGPLEATDCGLDLVGGVSCLGPPRRRRRVYALKSVSCRLCLYLFVGFWTEKASLFVAF